MQPLKLIALDQEDLTVLSAHLQDAVLQVADLHYLPLQKRFLAVVNRFDWLPGTNGARTRLPDHQRRRSALRFERVTAVQRRHIVQAAPAAVLSVLALQFTATVPPAGHIVLVCSGGGAIRLDVECIEAELRDLGPVWSTPNRPDHDLGEGDT